MSTYIKTSEITRFNLSSSTEPVRVSAGFIDVMNQAQVISKASAGAFDATVGPLVDAWGLDQVESEKNRRPLR